MRVCEGTRKIFTGTFPVLFRYLSGTLPIFLVPAMREATVEQYLSRRVSERGGLCWKWAATARAGVPDRVVVLRGVVYLVELKSPTGRLSPVQRRVHGMIERAGVAVHVLSSTAAVDEWLSRIVK